MAILVLKQIRAYKLFGQCVCPLIFVYICSRSGVKLLNSSGGRRTLEDEGTEVKQVRDERTMYIDTF